MTDATQLAATLRAQLAMSVLGQVGRYAGNLATVVQSNPNGSIQALLDRPDVAQSLSRSLAAARSHAAAAVQQSWDAAGGSQSSPVLAQLLQDVDRAYSEAPGLIHRAASQAWHSVPQQSFTVGVSTPGTNPVYQTALQRAQAVRDALSGQAQSLALRNGLSVNVAASSSHTADIRQQAGIPAGAQFPHPPEIGGHRPPKLYRGELLGPPLHPRCRCTLVPQPGGVVWTASMDGQDPKSCAWCRHLHGTFLASAPQLPVSEPVPPAQPEELPGMVSSEDIAAMPEERYQSLRHFLVSALHELAQVIRALLGIGGQ